jgi:predicted anti-sigma-YlaC factor YlaD
MFMEVMMARVITLDRGSKRRMKQIRWKLSEVISAVFISLIVLGLCVLVGLWEVSHYSEPPGTPEVTARH